MVLRALPCHKSGLAKNEDQREEKSLVRAAGVEPTTFGSGGRRSVQLSYARKWFRQNLMLLWEQNQRKLCQIVFQPALQKRTQFF